MGSLHGYRFIQDEVLWHAGWRQVHANLARRYQKPYKQICEGQYGDVELTRAVLRPLKLDLQDYGDEPLKPLRNIATARPVECQTLLEPKHVHRLAILHQVEALRAILSTRSPWDSLVYQYPRLADVVDHTAPHTGMAPEVMRERLIQLYQTYVCEWDSDSIRDSIGEGLLGNARMQGAA